MIGDYGKAVVVRRLVRQNLLQPDAPGVIVWGDGVNDATMLGDSEGATWRVAFNGSQAARTANIGVISEEIGRPGIVLTQIFEEHFKKYKERRPDRNQIAEVVNEAQARVGKDIIIHVAGPETDHGLLEEHEKMKTKIRGPRASTIDNLHV